MYTSPKFSFFALCKWLAIAMAVVGVPITLVVTVSHVAQEMARNGIQANGLSEPVVEVLLSLLAALVYGILIAGMLWFGWRIIGLVVIVKKYVWRHEYNRDDYTEASRKNHTDEQYILAHFRTSAWFKDAFWGMLGFIGVFLPLTWLLAGAITKEGVAYQLDPLSILSVLVAIPLLALGGAIAIWVNVALGAWILEKVRG